MDNVFIATTRPPACGVRRVERTAHGALQQVDHPVPFVSASSDDGPEFSTVPH